MYEQFEKGNSNINNILDEMQDEELLKQTTKIMADDYNIQDMNKAIVDIMNLKLILLCIWSLHRP